MPVVRPQTLRSSSYTFACRSGQRSHGGWSAGFCQCAHILGQTEWDFWTSADHTGTSAAHHIQAARSKVVPLENKITFIGNNGKVARGITGMLAAGHTPGHMAFTLEAAGRNLLITGDTANHYVASLQRPDWEVAFDMDKTGAAETRKRIFGMLAADRLPFIGYHMPHPSVATSNRSARASACPRDVPIRNSTPTKCPQLVLWRH
ncbi:MBL fold metallo-hydrolase [Phyllobacterium sp. CCNWLW109]|uniref:MBL fold metallo-hydrolase n=1 Tax=Phyllobacterium sp. CCNWLW109 TaxID=3127479 RepID=UPI0030777081